MKEEEKRDRRERFESLSEKRKDKAIKYIRSIGKLADSSNYKYSEEDAIKIIQEIHDELRALTILFIKGAGSVEQKFQRILDFDLAVIQSLEKTDPELYEYILKKQSKGSSALVEYLNEKREESEQLSRPDFLSKDVDKNKDNESSIRKLEQDLEKVMKTLEEIK
jgi:cell division protein ZapA (FtsZ GTPase activity inhibitor)